MIAAKQYDLRFKLAGETEINRFGYGTMRLIGNGIWGPPKDKAAAIANYFRKLEPINFIEYLNLTLGDLPGYADDRLDSSNLIA